MMRWVRRFWNVATMRDAPTRDELDDLRCIWQRRCDAYDPADPDSPNPRLMHYVNPEYQKPYEAFLQENKARRAPAEKKAQG